MMLSAMQYLLMTNGSYKTEQIGCPCRSTAKGRHEQALSIPTSWRNLTFGLDFIHFQCSIICNGCSFFFFKCETGRIFFK